MMRALAVPLMSLALALPAGAGDFFDAENEIEVEGASQMAAPDTPFAPREGASEAAFLPVERAFSYQAWRDGDTLSVGFDSADDYYLYRQSFALAAADPAIALSDVRIPRGEARRDEFLGDVEVFHGPVVLRATLERPPDGNEPVPLQIQFQGCAEAGLCYAPETRTIEALPGETPARFAAATGTVERDSESTATAGATDNGAAVSQGAAFSLPGQSQPLLMVGLLFLAGLGLVFTPCVLPMLPIVTSIVVGQHARRPRALALSGAYVLGMSLTYAALGLAMGLFGASLNLQARLQSPWVLVPFAALFLLLALWLLEAIQLPAGGRIRQRITGAQARLQRAGVPGAALAGSLSTLVVSPCISAPLAGVLAYLSAGASPALGALALFALGLGMGTPLMLIATLGAGWLPRSGVWLERVRQLFAVIMVALAIWLVERLLAPPLALLLWGLLALVTAVGAGALEGARTTLGARIRQGLALSLLIWGVLCLIGAALGGTSPQAPLAPLSASESGSQAPLEMPTVTDAQGLDAFIASARRPVMVEVYADWCVSCLRFEREVLSDPGIRERLAAFATVRLDVTANRPASRTLLDRLGLFGPPALLFYRNGEEVAAARHAGEIDRRETRALLDSVLERG